MTMRRARIAAAAAMGMVLCILALPAGAQESRTLRVLRVDSTDPEAVEVVFTYDGPADDVDGLALAEDGKSIEPAAVGTLADGGVQQGVVFVIDSSKSTDPTAVLAEGRRAVRALIGDLPAATQYAIVTAGGNASLVQRFTTDGAAIDRTLDALSPLGDGALWGGVVRASATLEDNPALVPTIVLITDGNDGGTVTSASAEGSVTTIGAQVFVLAIDGGSLDGGARTLSEQTGGRYLQSTKASDLVGLAEQLVPDIAGRYVLTYAAASDRGAVDLSLSVGGATSRNTYVVGSIARGESDLELVPTESRDGVEFFQNDMGKLLAVLLAMAAAGLLAWSAISLVSKSRTKLDTALLPYSDGFVAEGEGDSGDLAQTAFMQRAVAFTHQMVERQGMLSKVENALERANVPLRAGEYVFFCVAGVLVLTLLTWAITQDPLVALVALVILALLPIGALNFLASRRRKQFEGQLPDMLQLLAATLRAGYSMMQGVEAVSEEVAEPMGRELRRVVTESRLGRPLEDALDAVADRMDSGDFRWATMAIKIQREVGGNLSELLMTVADTMAQRERLRRDVNTLTAEGRISAYVLGFLPFGLAATMYTLNPDYMTSLFDDSFGVAMTIASAVMMAVGFVWMNKIIKIDI